MSTFAQSIYGESEFGIPQDLPHAGSSLENPYAFDATAQDLKHMAKDGRVKILAEHINVSLIEPLIDSLTFVRLR